MLSRLITVAGPLRLSAIRNLLMPLAITFLVAVSSTASASDVVPTSITVQGRLTDSSGNPLPAGLKTFTFRIYDWPTAGNKVWPEIGNEVQPLESDADGLWTAAVGAFVPLREPVFATWERWLEIDVDGTTLPRVRLFTSPYAFRVATVDGATGGAITSKVSIGSGHTNSGADAFVAGVDNQVTGNYATVSGGTLNDATGESSVISGGQQNDAIGFTAAVGGGASNTASGQRSRIGGGLLNTTSGSWSVVDGGVLNLAANEGAAVGGGGNNLARGPYSTVGGGGGSNAADSNSAKGTHSAIGGGRANIASGDSTVIAGGSSNRATGLYAVVGGGVQNWAAGGGATIAGGGGNSAGGGSATVGGGAGNNAFNTYSVVAGGRINTASGYISTVGGGDVNTASSHYATVPGGFENVASGSFSFAAGGRAHALHTNTFVWASGNIQRPPFGSTGVDQFLVNAPGGVGLGTNAPQQQLSVAGGMNIDHGNTNTGDVTNSFRFGSSSGEAIASKRTAGGNQFGLDFYTNSVSRMSINNADGYVGIGTTSPVQTLDVNGTLTVGATVSGTSRHVTLGSDPNAFIQLVESDGSGLPYIDFSNDAVSDFDARIMLTGDDQLAVEGASVSVAGNVCAANLACPSDERLKEGVHPLAEAVDQIERLHGVSYRWTDAARKGRHLPSGEQIGLLAQDVQKVVPQAVHEMSDGYLAVDYARLVPLLIEGMKEQQKRIEALEKQLERRAP